jgi:hypothetical protein
LPSKSKPIENTTKHFRSINDPIVPEKQLLCFGYVVWQVLVSLEEVMIVIKMLFRSY